jgi:molybdopterin/thiamine biosynthesis adenylyltransferase/rhodanese-related sulfurtransferase
MSEQPEVSLETTAEEAARLACDDRPLIDIRSPGERQLGAPALACTVHSDDLLEDGHRHTGKHGAGGFVICAEGVRSLDTVRRLRQSGYQGYSSVTGGFRAWREAGLPVSYPEGFNAEQVERYARHLVMPQVGAGGQRKLLDSRILLAGLGGLNSPVALYLAAAGVGALGLVDFDTVERSNLQRQIVHGENRLGQKKIDSAGARILALNPDVHIELFDEMIDESNAASLVAPWDIVVDGTDSFPSRYALNDACITHAKPLVYGAVMRFQGQVSVFWPEYPGSDPAGGNAAPCFRCMMPDEPRPQETPACSEAGVLGVLPGIVGTLQANEALKIALGIGEPLVGRLLLIDGLNMEFRQMSLAAKPGCPSCSRP